MFCITVKVTLKATAIDFFLPVCKPPFFSPMLNPNQYQNACAGFLADVCVIVRLKGSKIKGF